MNPIYEENSMEVLFIDFPEIHRINLESPGAGSTLSSGINEKKSKGYGKGLKMLNIVI